MKNSCANCKSTHQFSGCGIFDSDGSNCSWWKEMFQSGSSVEIQDDSYEFYLNGGRSGAYARGLIVRKVDDRYFTVKLFCNGKECKVNKDWLKLV